MTNNAIATSILNSETILNEKKKLIAKLEHKNREILREIKRLRIQQESNRSLDENGLNLTTSLSRESTPLTINSNHTSKSILNYQLINPNYSIQQPQQPNLMAELKSLKQRKGELDSRIQTLEQNRNELLSQLSTVDNVMKNMKMNSFSTRSTPIRAPLDQTQVKYSTLNTQMYGGGTRGQMPMTTSALGSLSTTPYNDSLMQLLQTTYKAVNLSNTQLNLPPNSLYQQQQHQQQNVLNPIKSFSLPTTPAMSDYYSNYNYMKNNSQQYYSSGHETISSNCSSNANVRNLRNDLLIAADSVTNAMHCLVKELNSGKYNLIHLFSHQNRLID